MLALPLLRALGSSTATTTPCHSEIRNAKNDTALSTFLWELKKSTKETPKLTWSVLKFVPAYSNISKRCLLCLNEKLLIATYPDQKQLLNKRSELIAKCRHENKFLCKTND